MDKEDLNSANITMIVMGVGMSFIDHLGPLTYLGIGLVLAALLNLVFTNIPPEE